MLLPLATESPSQLLIVSPPSPMQIVSLCSIRAGLRKREHTRSFWARVAFTRRCARRKTSRHLSNVVSLSSTRFSFFFLSFSSLFLIVFFFFLSPYCKFSVSLSDCKLPG